MKIENVVKIKIPNCLTTEEMTICLLGEDSLIRKLCILPMKSK